MAYQSVPLQSPYVPMETQLGTALLYDRARMKYVDVIAKESYSERVARPTATNPPSVPSRPTNPSIADRLLDTPLNIKRIENYAALPLEQPGYVQ